jgi:hypothetical protein
MATHLRFFSVSLRLCVRFFFLFLRDLRASPVTSV